MNDINQLFFDLIQVSLGNKNCLLHTPSAEEWKVLYKMSKEQALNGICFAGVQRLQRQQQCPPEAIYDKWMAMSGIIRQRNMMVDRQCAELQERIKKLGYRSCIVKGQKAAELYKYIDNRGGGLPLASLRQSGDIDIWIDAPRKEIIRMVQQIAPTTNVREHHLEMHLYRDTEIEVHFWPAVIRHFLKNKRLQAWFDTKRMEVMEQGFPTLEFHAIQMMAHMYHHLFDSGIGLRQVMDYYMVLCTVSSSMIQDSGSIKIQEVSDAIKHIGMGRFASAMMYVLQETMGLEREKMICNPNEKDGRFLLGEIMRGGNFGHHDDRKVRDTSNYFSSFYGSIFRNLRYLRFNPFDWFWSPLWRLYYFGWRKMNGWK